MNVKNTRKHFLCLVLLFVGFLGFSQLSKKHFIPPLTSSAFGNANPEDQYIYISTPSNSLVPYTIMPVGQPATSYITGTVSNTTPQVEAIGTGNGQLFVSSNSTSLVTKNKGYIIEAEAPIYISIRMNAGNGAQAGALVSKGLSAPDTTFRIGTFTNENPQDNYLSFISVMATEDNSQVTFNNLPAGLIIKNYSGSIPITVTLNEGESYIIATNSFEQTSANRDGLIGSLVTSNKPIVVNCGSANGSFHNGGGRDYGIDQIAGLSKIGREYICVRGGGSDNWENILVVAHTNNTIININGVAGVATINAGDYFLIEGNSFSAQGNMYIETSQNAFVYQGIGASSEANQGMFFVPPLSCETRGNIDNIPIIDFIGGTPYNEDSGVSIVTKTGASVTVNSSSSGAVNIGTPSNVIGNTNYITYRVTGLRGNISVQGDDELYVAYFNVNNAATSGAFYSGFPSKPEINFDLQFTTLGNCIPNVTLEAANAQNFDSYEWFYNDGSGFKLLAANVASITPTVPARYKLIGTITCTGETLESVEVPVSICPDDNDNDGIIDNLDIDNDNDGILNCTESRGDVTLNISNETNPILVFQDNSTNNTIASGIYTETSTSGNNNSITGDNLGNFTSIVGSAASAEGNYTITYTEPVNIKITEHTSVLNTPIDGEIFIVRIAPSNKNITLIDPDNRLLVDSNFDGLFETGVTQISGSEIHFRINATSNGTTPFEFLANAVEGFSFIHQLQNITDPSSFTANLSLTCFKKDYDNDGIKDSFDLDSDNDGIPDILEGDGKGVTLTGIDDNNDGLDDQFNPTASPVDSDFDGVYDYYDLDSDNDGIYDLEESGSGLNDANLDGIIDNINSTIGINGWDNNAESGPDSNLIGYIVRDSDTDTVYNYFDHDSDGDDCSDVFEAGFSDGNNDNYLGDSTPTVTSSGIVNNASDGYSIPNNTYLNSAPLTISTQPINTAVCEASNTALSIVSSEATVYQWEVNIDGINWITITDDITYKGSQTDQLNITNTPLSFQSNTYRVKIDRNGNSCGLYSNEAILSVNSLPVLNTPVVLVQCDDDDLSTLGFSFFNLTEANNEISANAVNETFTYFLNELAAISGDITSPDYIGNPTTFENRTVSNDIVWARVVSEFGCASVSEIQLSVSTTVIPPTFLVPFNQCDDFLDVNGNDNTNNDDRDGIATFDFSSVSSAISGFIPPGQNPLPPKYYRNEADALAEINAISDIKNYRNIGYPGSQYIFVRIDSAISNDCLGLGPYVLLNVEALPLANSVSIDRQCDDDTDGQFPFDTSLVESTVLGSQNLSDVTITYFDELGVALPSPLPNPFITSNQTITIRVTNNTTSAPDGPCYDETTLTFTVDVQPFANPVVDQIVCDGSAGDIDDDGLYPFDTSTFNNTVLGSQVGMEIYYDYTDENGNLQSRATSLPNPLIALSQIINIEVVNPENSICNAFTTINLVVNPLPEFTVDTPKIVCTSDPTFSVDLEPLLNNPSESFVYEWLWTSLDGSVNNQFVSNDEIITVSIPGTYSITLTKTDGTGCFRQRDIFVDASELATITQNDVTIKDLSENNTVAIDTTNLGVGTYEYALSEENSNFVIYQSEPVFYNVNPGFYTIYVQDVICGVATLDISVIGHAKFFTPNGDGVNDTWQIKGIGGNIQPNSIVYIFDRYGKLLKQLSVQSSGWDGTFNGSQLPSNDYWFKLQLEDGRLHSGHFTLKR